MPLRDRIKIASLLVNESTAKLDTQVISLEILACLRDILFKYKLLQFSEPEVITDIFDIKVYKMFVIDGSCEISEAIYKKYRQLINATNLSHKKLPLNVSSSFLADCQNEETAILLKEPKSTPVTNNLIEVYASECRSMLPFTSTHYDNKFTFSKHADENYRRHTDKQLLDDHDNFAKRS